MMPQPLERTPKFTSEATDELIAIRKGQISKLEIELESLYAARADADLMSDKEITESVLASINTQEKTVRLLRFLLAEDEARKKTLDDAANGKT